MRNWAASIVVIFVVGIAIYLWTSLGRTAENAPASREATQPQAAPRAEVVSTPETAAPLPGPIPSQAETVATKGPDLPCEIRGMVYQPDGAAAANATIEFGWRPDSDGGEDGLPSGWNTTTDVDGTFTLAGLPVGRSVLRASHETGAIVQRVQLFGHEPFLRVSLVLRGGEAIAGIVTARDGRPVASARVMPLAHEGEEDWAENIEARAVRTGDDGAFVLRGLEPGNWTLHASAEGFGEVITDAFPTGVSNARIMLAVPIALTCRVEGADSGEGVGGITIVLASADHDLASRDQVSGDDGVATFSELGAGNYTVDIRDSRVALVGDPIEVTLDAARAAAPVTLRVEEGGVIYGRVSDDTTGEGVPNLTMSASQRGRERFDSPPTDLDGNYTIGGLPAGDYRVRPPRSLPGYPQDPQPRYEKRVSVQPGGATEGVDFVLTKGATLSGSVVDPDGNPVSGATVRGHNEMGSLKMTSVITGDDGRFAFWDYEAGEAVSLGADTPTRKSEVAGPFVAGEPGSDAIELVLERDCGGIIAGRVVDRRQQPVSCKLMALATEKELQFPLTPPHTKTDGHGNFVLTGVCPGSYTLVMEPPSNVRQEHGPVVVVPGRSVTGLKLVYDQGEVLELSGAVVDYDENPIPNAFVKANRVNGTNIMPGGGTLSDGNGGFTFKELPEGTYMLSAQHPDFVSLNTQAEAGRSDVMVVMRRAPRVSGQVSGAGGDPLGTFTVSLYPTGHPDVARSEQTVTDSTGQFSITAARAGDWTLEVNAAGFEPAVIDLGELRLDKELGDMVVTLNAAAQ